MTVTFAVIVLNFVPAGKKKLASKCATGPDVTRVLHRGVRGNERLMKLDVGDGSL